ncbi:MAG: hypothetical protein A3F17_07885 [Gammaproteobacteria bacterium RIFCSPHIGHO2_12_FULL_41_15]|nr:MAG: hypothetical protein A3F17_07885 [Gammaproteobacteria bacterium RIFCSPHIGHO2_12_FULL_41_15]
MHQDLFTNHKIIEQRPETEKVLCLSIDGGGIRGLMAAEILACLEKELHENLYNTFDMYAGTSTGSMIALNIAANQFNAERIVEWYLPEKASIIFTLSRLRSYMKNKVPNSLYLMPRARYTGHGKREYCKQLFGEKKFHAIEKPILVTAYNFVNNTTAIFKSTGGTEVQSHPYVYEVCDASSAAPIYFPPVKVGDHWLIDGGISANNPSLCLISYAFEFGYRIKQIYMVSIGTGRHQRKFSKFEYYAQNAFNWNGFAWLTHGLIENFMDGNTTTTDYLANDLLRRRICRINPVLDQVNYQLDDNTPENLKNLRALGREIYQEYRTELLSLIDAAKA